VLRGFVEKHAGRETATISRRSAIGLAVTGASALVLSTRKAMALDYPTRTVRFVVGYPAGGATDIIARLIGQKLSERMGQQFVIENKAGAGNNIGTELVVNAAPDGYTVLLVIPANFINTKLYANLSFNFLRDIAPVASFLQVPNVMTVAPGVPAKTVGEFIAYVKDNPGKVNLASSGNGTSVHLSGEMFMAMTGARMLHVPYKGAAPAITDLLGNRVQVMRALAVTTAVRSPVLPDVPTVAETVPGYEASALFGVGAPKNTPADIIARLNGEINAVLAESEVAKRLNELGGPPLISTPAGFGTMIADETAKWEKVVKSAGLKIE
jgi:tripartite-type tricarboxylate transporter receptor subunit TctC